MHQILCHNTVCCKLQDSQTGILTLQVVNCSSAAPSFLPISGWIHTFSYIYSNQKWPQKVGFIAELSQRSWNFHHQQSWRRWNLCCFYRPPEQHAHPWCQSSLSPSRLCWARSQCYISLSHAAVSQKLLPSCSMSRTGRVEKKRDGVHSAAPSLGADG